MIDTSNKFLVASMGGNLTIMNVPAVTNMTPDDAILLAAWLVAMAQPSATVQFGDVIEAVEQS